MRNMAAALVVPLALAACQQQDAAEPQTGAPVEAERPTPSAASSTVPETIGPGLRWVTSGDGTAARLLGPDGAAVMTVACLADTKQLRVQVPGFERIGSEDRLSFSFSDDPIALAVDARGSGRGVTGSGSIPADITTRIGSAQAVVASYGSQTVGPHIPPSGAEAEVLADACTKIVGTAPFAPENGDASEARAAIPARFQGVYDEDRSACRAASSVQRLAVGPGRLRFHESIGVARKVVVDEDGMATVTASYDGEGMQWQSTRRLALSADGRTLTIIGDGTKTVRVRCP